MVKKQERSNGGVYIVIIIILLFVLALWVTPKLTRMQERMDNEVCNEIGMNFLRKSGAGFGTKYIVCYNPQTNETRNIPI